MADEHSQNDDKALNHNDTEDRLLQPIQVVAQRSGLTADVIRVWERRYDAVTPKRSDTNQRLYEESDIERLRLLRLATQNGRRISAIAQMSTEELETLISEDQTETNESRPALTHHRIKDCLIAIRDMQPVELERQLNAASVSMGLIPFVTEFITPLMRDVGLMWRTGKIRTSEEHFATAHVRSHLGKHINQANSSHKGPVIVIGTLPGQIHEIGALMAAITASSAGWQTVYLGADVPPEELAFAADNTQARAIATSISYPFDDPSLSEHIVQLKQLLNENVDLIIGGPNTKLLDTLKQQAPITVIDDLIKFSYHLDELRMASVG